MQFVYVRDLVEAMVHAMTEPRAEGEAFNIGESKPVTHIELVEKLARVANVEPTLVRVPRDAIQAAGGNAMTEPLLFRRVPGRAAHHRVHGQGAARAEDEDDAVRRRPEGNLPVVRAQPQAALCGIRFRRPADGDVARRIGRQRLSLNAEVQLWRN